MAKKIRVYEEHVIATVVDKGDPSVGIFAMSFEVECPFRRSDVDDETLEWFRGELTKLYVEFAEGRVMVDYDFEDTKD